MTTEVSEGARALDARLESVIESLHFAAPEMWKEHLYRLYSDGFGEGVDAVTQAWLQEKQRKAIFHLDGQGVIKAIDHMFGMTSGNPTDAG